MSCKNLSPYPDYQLLSYYAFLYFPGYPYILLRRTTQKKTMAGTYAAPSVINLLFIYLHLNFFLFHHVCIWSTVHLVSPYCPEQLLHHLINFCSFFMHHHHLSSYSPSSTPNPLPSDEKYPTNSSFYSFHPLSFPSSFHSIW
jgi:hypothetical protein